MRKILLIFGTRPEAIKMAPVIKELQKHKENLKSIVCVTSQHKQMLNQVLSLFEIEPDINLGLMRENQNLASLTADALRAINKVISNTRPSLILVQGDTTTAFVSALAGFYNRIPVGHIEAGLRTKDRYNPFPEEVNRRTTGILASYHFAPTRKALKYLLSEGAAKENVFLTGNTIVDALHMIIGRGPKPKFKSNNPDSRKLILVTAHRRENFGKPLENICRALKEIVRRNADVDIIYPVHMNPNVRKTVGRMLVNQDRINLTPPLKYDEFINLLNRSYLVLTDSGGVQEEAPVFGKPVLVLRGQTERPEGVEAGAAKIAGTDTKDIVKFTELLLRDKARYAKMSKIISPYGDGKAAKRIVKVLLGEVFPR